MKLRTALIVMTTAMGLSAGPALAAAKPFAEYWVPQSDGERVFTYYLGKREIAPGRFKVRYRSVEDFHRKHSEWTEAASVDCPGKRIDRIERNQPAVRTEIDEAGKEASMATIVDQNLWWLVCRGVPEKYRPPE